MAKKEDDLKEASFNMKKYFKTPEDLTKVGFKAYRDKRLKSVLSKGLVNAPFLYITNFKFDGTKGEEENPMIFIGDINGFWKKAINTDFKRRKEFAQGVCTLTQDDDGNRKLVFDVQKGKGKRDVNLRMINKTLLKKFKICAEYAGKTLSEAAADEKIASVGEEVVSQVTSVFGRIKQEIARFQKMAPEDMEQRVHQISLIFALIGEWDISYKKHKSERKDEAKQIKKLKAYLKEASKKYNQTNLNSQLLDSLKEDLRSYLISRKEFLGNVKTYDLAQKQEALTNLWQEIQILKSNISDWKVVNPKPNKEEIKAIGQIEARTKIEEKDLIKWMKKDKVDIKSIQEYNPRRAETKEADEKELAILAAMTNLPKISKPTFASGTFKKLYKAYEQYGTINAQDIEMRKIKLLEISAYVSKWHEEYKAKNSLKKKFVKNEKAEVEKIEKDLVTLLEAINTYTQKRDNYVDIMAAHREFKKLVANFESTSENDDKAAYLMDNINYMIEEWQMHYTNISSFGTKKKNKKLEAIRQELVDFVKQQGANKQTDDTSAIVDQLTKSTSEANAKELEALQTSETEKFYGNADNKKKLDAINQEREELKAQEEKLNAKLKTGSDAPTLIALNGVKFQQRSLDRQKLELERPIREVVDKKREELNTSLINDKKDLIQKIVVSVATQLSESADNGEFSAKLFEARDTLKAYARIIKNPQRVSEDELKAAKIKYKKLKEEEKTLQARAAKEAFPKISALAKHLAQDLAKKHQLTVEQFEEVLQKLDDHTTYISNNLDDEAQKLCNETDRKSVV